MVRKILLDGIKIDRQTIINLAQLFAYEEGTCLLFSGGFFETSKSSFLCLFPYEFVVIHGEKQERYYSDFDHRTSVSRKNPWDALKDLLPEFDPHHDFPEWVGFLGYEMGAFSDPEKILPYSIAPSPEVFLQRSSLILSVDHEHDLGTLWIMDKAAYFLPYEKQQWLERLSNPAYWPELLAGLKQDGQSHIFSYSLLTPKETLESYTKKIEAAKELIHAGEIYQINLSQQFQLTGSGNPFDLFKEITKINPAPFSAYMRFPNFVIVSSSPERLLRKKDLLLETRPIKGTVPRGATLEEDKSNLEYLLSSPKERAELMMITDLMRNDLGKVSLPGSVETAQVMSYETLNNVYHLYSVVRSHSKPGLHPVDYLRCCFPGGSITGCPKLTAMQVIADLEKSPRGIYTGAIGYFMGNGDFDFNIAIRTLYITKESITVQLGGGIVADSIPEKEYQETLHKGASIFKALGVRSEFN